MRLGLTKHLMSSIQSSRCANRFRLIPIYCFSSNARTLEWAVVVVESALRELGACLLYLYHYLALRLQRTPSNTPNPQRTAIYMAPAPAPVKQTSSGGSDRSNFRRIEDEEVKPYVIVSDLGKGSFATVYRGYHEVRDISTTLAVDLLSDECICSKHTGR